MNRPDLINSETALSQIRDAYLDALVRGDVVEAGELVESALALGASIQEAYLSVICAAQDLLGTLWENDKISITQEHVATQISLKQISALRQRLKPKKALGLKALVSTPFGDPHLFAAQVVSDFLYFEGWEVSFPGSNTPDADLLEFIEKHRFDLVCFSVSLTPSHSFKLFLSKLKGLEPSPKIIIGGIGSKSLGKSKYVDAVTSNITDALKAAKTLLGVSGSEATLNQYLKTIGERIFKHRKAKALSQDKLAALADIDRPYLSAIENGKQNVTIAVLHKIALGLGLVLEELLESGDRSI